MTDAKVIFQSPTERGEHVRVIAAALSVRVTSLPEQRGVDFLWRVDVDGGEDMEPGRQGRWIGVQRKTIADLCASVDDGRLQKELGQIKENCSTAYVIVEGKTGLALDGTMQVGYRSIPVTTHMARLASLMSMGVNVIQTESARHTGMTIVALHRWTNKGKHQTGLQRPKAKGAWGKASSREWAIHLLQGFPGIGHDTAAAIVDVHGLPLRWTVGVEELLAVDGIGKVRARQLIAALATERGVS